MNYVSVKLPRRSHACLAGEGQEQGLHCKDTISCLLLCSAWILVARFGLDMLLGMMALVKRPLAGLSMALCSLSQTLSLTLPLTYPLG